MALCVRRDHGWARVRFSHHHPCLCVHRTSSSSVERTRDGTGPRRAPSTPPSSRHVPNTYLLLLYPGSALRRALWGMGDGGGGGGGVTTPPVLEGKLMHNMMTLHPASGSAGCSPHTTPPPTHTRTLHHHIPPPVLYLTATQALLKHLEARRRVVYVDEYNTSQFCPECDTRLVYHSNREKRCDECKTVWNRDLVGALNQKKVFEYWWQHGERPAHLCRPAAPESTPGAAAATARRSRKRRAAASDLDPDPDLDTTGGATDSAAEDAQQPGGPPARRRAKVCVCMCVCMCVCAGPRKSSGCERGCTRGGLAASSWLPPPPLHQCIPTPTVTVVQLA